MRQVVVFIGWCQIVLYFLHAVMLISPSSRLATKTSERETMMEVVCLSRKHYDVLVLSGLHPSTELTLLIVI